MKKNVKNSVFFRMELLNFSVVIRYATDAEQLLHNCLYSFVYRDNNNNKHFTEIRGFNHYEDAHTYMFENYAWMFIPTNLVLHEGTRLFVY